MEVLPEELRPGNLAHLTGFLAPEKSVAAYGCHTLLPKPLRMEDNARLLCLVCLMARQICSYLLEYANGHFVNFWEDLC